MLHVNDSLSHKILVWQFGVLLLQFRYLKTLNSEAMEIRFNFLD